MRDAFFAATWSSPRQTNLEVPVIRIAFLALACAVSVPAHAFYRSELKLTITREHIRDEKPVDIASLPLTQARYDNDSSCFLLGRFSDIACETTLDRSPRPDEYAFALDVSPAALKKMFEMEFSWAKPEYREELLASFPLNRLMRFRGPANERHLEAPRSLSLIPVSFKTRDGKVTFTIR